MSYVNPNPSLSGVTFPDLGLTTRQTAAGLLLMIGGVLFGVLLAKALTRSIATLLIGVSFTDALGYAVATLLLGGIGLWVNYAQAQRTISCVNSGWLAGPFVMHPRVARGRTKQQRT
jgi:hypothetical protein